LDQAQLSELAGSHFRGANVAALDCALKAAGSCALRRHNLAPWGSALIGV